MTTPIKAPFPYFGGKSRVAHQVWARLGDVPNYVEPFAGSLAVLLSRPTPPKTETVNDADGLLCNFWRAIQADPDQVAHHADWPVSECDLHARHAWLVGRKAEYQARLEGDPAWYDARAAGWWVWGISCWIGRGWCSGEGPWRVLEGRLVRGEGDGAGIVRRRSAPGQNKGVTRQLPHMNRNTGVHRSHPDGLIRYMRDLAARIRRVRICCGDWTRVCGPSPTRLIGLTGVFLDPPYSHDSRDHSIYACEMETAAAVRAWALAHGGDPRMRIALCGYDGEHTMPPDWEAVSWTSAGGYAMQGNGRGRLNRTRERIWFSPHCLRPESTPEQQELFR